MIRRPDIDTRKSNIRLVVLSIGAAVLLISFAVTTLWIQLGEARPQSSIIWHHADSSIDAHQVKRQAPITQLPQEALDCIAKEAINTSLMALITLPYHLSNGLGQQVQAYRSLYLYPENDIVSHAIIRGGWEKPEINQFDWAMSQPLPAGYQDTKLFVDIGANVGWFTLNMAARGYQVEAFEAMTANQNLIMASSCANPDLKPRIKLHRHGLGTESKTCYVFSDSKNVGDGVTECTWASEQEAMEKTPPAYELRGTMEIKRLDAVLKSDIKAIKMDVEGYEQFVLEGASGLFKNHKVWFMALELNSFMLKAGVAKIEPLDYLRRLEAMGYRVSLNGFQGPFEDLSLSAAALEPLKAKVDPSQGFVGVVFCTHKLLLDTKPEPRTEKASQSPVSIPKAVEKVNQSQIVSPSTSAPQGFKCGGPAPEKSIKATISRIPGGKHRVMYLYGTEMVNNYQKKDIVSQMLAQGQPWEEDEINQLSWAMSQPLPAGHQDTKLFVDIGANVGWFTLNMAARGYQVEAFEAMSINQGLLDATLCENKDLQAHVNFHRYGLGARSTKCFVFSGNWNSGNGMLDCKSKTREEAQAKLTQEHYVRSEMEIKRLDAVLGSDIKAVKMDVEGYEPFVLEGASGLFKNHKVWFITLECNQPVLEVVAGKNCVDLAKMLHELGYRVSTQKFSGPFIAVETKEGADKLKLEVENSPYKIKNLFCSHRDLNLSLI